MCDECPLQAIADAFPKSATRVNIWHGKDGDRDVVQVSIVRDNTDDLVATAPTCREAVAELLRLLNERQTERTTE